MLSRISFSRCSPHEEPLQIPATYRDPLSPPGDKRRFWAMPSHRADAPPCSVRAPVRFRIKYSRLNCSSSVHDPMRAFPPLKKNASPGRILVLTQKSDPSRASPLGDPLPAKGFGFVSLLPTIESFLFCPLRPADKPMKGLLPLFVKLVASQSTHDPLSTITAPPPFEIEPVDMWMLGTDAPPQLDVDFPPAPLTVKTLALTHREPFPSG